MFQNGTIGIIDVRIKKSRTSLLSTEVNPCLYSGDQRSFIHCIWNFIHDILNEAGCWTAPTKLMFNDTSDFKECTDLDIVKKMDKKVRTLLIDIARNPGTCM